VPLSLAEHTDCGSTQARNTNTIPPGSEISEEQRALGHGCLPRGPGWIGSPGPFSSVRVRSSTLVLRNCCADLQLLRARLAIVRSLFLFPSSHPAIALRRLDLRAVISLFSFRAYAMSTSSPYASTFPSTRWWWFSQPMRKRDIKEQLLWLRSYGFGGVEVAFIYPLSSDALGPPMLSKKFSSLLKYTKKKCEELRMHCDFTFGSMWPFAGSWVSEEDSLHTFYGPHYHRKLKRSWELQQCNMLDHLSSQALRRYAAALGNAMKPALATGGTPSALFCDSWELPSQTMWSPALTKQFRELYGYDLLAERAALITPDEDGQERSAIFYDYLRFIAAAVTREFYASFTSIAHELGSFTRVQCHGSPTDLLASYAAVDVPESEALLFPVSFSRIPASAAALSGKLVVSCETFTCMYGFPDAMGGIEQVADMKLLADAVFANGVNHIFWHGTAFQSPTCKEQFFATVHVDPRAPFLPHLLAFNTYLGRVQQLMREGQTLQYACCYLPFEDMVMLGNLPRELRTPGAVAHWEMRHVRPPAELAGYFPLWISEHHLRLATVVDGQLTLPCEAARKNTGFRLLHLDSKYLDAAALQEVLRLARQGLRIVVKRRPLAPGRNRDQAAYARMLTELTALSNVATSLEQLAVQPLLVPGGADGASGLPKLHYWIRVLEPQRYRIFFSHPLCSVVQYPMTLGQSFTAELLERRLSVQLPGCGFLSHPLANLPTGNPARTN
jgi:hypothetical protein